MKNGVVKLVVRDKKNDTSNEYAVVVGETDQYLHLILRVENIKIIPGAYDVVVSSKLLSKFSNTRYDFKILHCVRTRLNFILKVSV